MEISREQLQEKNLFELRTIAREAKVSSPTVYAKEELIRKIIEASNSILSDTGSQLWINQNKAIWNMPRSSFDV